MKLWDSLTTCLILLSALRASPLPRGDARRSPSAVRRRGRVAESPLEPPPVQNRMSVTAGLVRRSEAESAGWDERVAPGETYSTEGPLPADYQDMVDFIRAAVRRTRRSSASTVSSSTSSSVTSSPIGENLSNGSRHRREKKSGESPETGSRWRRRGVRDGLTGRRQRGGGGGGGRGQGCVLKQIHLNVSDLGLGYRSGEEMIFRYCSGPCRKSETNYDKILYTLTHSRRLSSRDSPPQACCRPIAFDDDLSFLDDNLVYHTVKRHSARKCGCV